HHCFLSDQRDALFRAGLFQTGTHRRMAGQHRPRLEDSRTPFAPVLSVRRSVAAKRQCSRGRGGAPRPAGKPAGGGGMSATAFDVLAARYDELWTESPAGRAQRELVWRELDLRFHPGQRILDIGCGTGVDAAHFAARGVDVEALDASPAMVARAEARGGFRT